MKLCDWENRVKFKVTFIASCVCITSLLYFLLVYLYFSQDRFIVSQVHAQKLEVELYQFIVSYYKAFCESITFSTGLLVAFGGNFEKTGRIGKAHISTLTDISDLMVLNKAQSIKRKHSFFFQFVFSLL